MLNIFSTAKLADGWSLCALRKEPEIQPPDASCNSFNSFEFKVIFGPKDSFENANRSLYLKVSNMALRVGVPAVSNTYSQLLWALTNVPRDALVLVEFSKIRLVGRAIWANIKRIQPENPELTRYEFEINEFLPYDTRSLEEYPQDYQSIEISNAASPTKEEE